MSSIVSTIHPKALSPLDEALWREALDAPETPLREFFSRAAPELRTAVNIWTLIEESHADATPALDRLAAMPTVSDARWFGEARLFLNEDHLGPYLFAAMPTGHQGTLHLVSSISATDDRWRRLHRWVMRAVAALSPVYLNESEFLGLGDSLAEHGAVAASRLTARDLGDGSSYTRGWPERRRRPRPSHRQALAEARNMAVRTLTLHVGGRLLLQLRREAGATFYSGDFRLFDEVVLGGLALAAADRRRLLVDRERHIDEPLPQPLVIRTLGATFAEPEAILDLLDTLERQLATGVAVFHRNPYLHAAVTDYSDGSNFDIFVHESHEVVVIPGYRATLRALARLTDAVSERFAAVEVAEVERSAPPTLRDFVGDV